MEGAFTLRNELSVEGCKNAEENLQIQETKPYSKEAPASPVAGTAATANTCNGQKVSNQKQGSTIDLTNFKESGEKTFTQCGHPFEGALSLSSLKRT
jgi:hypothetical protein